LSEGVSGLACQEWPKVTAKRGEAFEVRGRRGRPHGPVTHACNVICGILASELSAKQQTATSNTVLFRPCGPRCWCWGFC
jgi:hypothetical protein